MNLIQTGRTTPFETRGAVASLGAFGYELDLSKLSEKEKERVKGQIGDYKEIADLVLKGDLYRLSDPFQSNYFCEMLVSKDKTRAYIVGERFRNEPIWHEELIKIHGLADEKIYRIAELNVTVSGKALSGKGIVFPRIGDCESWTWHIEEVPAL